MGEIEELEIRTRDTEVKIRKFFDDSIKTMVKKNKDRGDCWRNSGLLAQFIEIHSMYFRLRNLIYLKGWPNEDIDGWKDQVNNALEDMRNFTVLAQICVEENNYKGIEINEHL